MNTDRPNSAGNPPPTPSGVAPADGDGASAAAPVFDSTQLKNAFKAFKKRLKMARLDDESRLGRGPMSGGGHSGIVAIVPPNQYPQAVWDELARQGKLSRAGHGLYELGEET